jgi:DNA polymerase III alpha subunit
LCNGFVTDYICTKEDKDIIEKIKSQPLKKVLVHISGAFLTREPGMSLSQNCSRGW